MKSLKKNNILKKLDSNLQIQTIEGKDAYLDAIKFLQLQQPVPPLKEETRLSSAAWSWHYYKCIWTKILC